MNKIKFVGLIIFSQFYFYSNAQTLNDRIRYSQKVTRECRISEKPFSNKRGVLLLTNDSLIFKYKKEKLSEFNFSVSYEDIRTIKPFYGFLYPNRIKIRAKSGEWYRLFTYKKRHILRITREKMKSF